MVRRLLGALAALTISAAACGGSKSPEATPEPEATSTAEPTPARAEPSASEAPAPTGEPVPASAGAPTVPNVPGVTRARCSPKSVAGTGITDKDVTIAQIVTDVSALPQQFGPARDGLQAYVAQANAAGGACGRKLKLEVRNDNSNPATHGSDARTLAGRAFAFVANESLFDNTDYEDRPPFNPTTTDDGEPVPDVGGLAFSINRSQSPWHAGVVGSVSPVLFGGGNFKFYAQEARRAGTPCRKGAVTYLREPTGASEEQARLGEVAVQRNWGAGLGASNTKLYAANLLDPVPAYEVMVDQMVADGMNCVFSFMDRGSSVNLVRAMYNRGVWPPKSCTRGAACFRVVWITLAAVDTRFISDGGPGALNVSTFIPHVPLNETSNPAMKSYLSALKNVSGARASTFSVLAYASGRMFTDAFVSCGGAPTRRCVMNHLRGLKDFTGGGLIGDITPFRRRTVTYGNYGTFPWKGIFTCTVSTRVLDKNGKRDFYRVNPAKGFFCDELNVARGKPA